ncbi:hypothetical protein [Membranihabitans marinus]|uniref:hypothetical protein n=1 Tax=Membranihabitans marinus TaxID=1227546 RepID=UPI001F32C59C|nr:hypothetical protein [Membranihabitans marinus]
MMKFLCFLVCSLLTISMLRGQDDSSKYFKLVNGGEGSNKYRIELNSDVDTSWSKWHHRGYSFGFDPSQTPMYTQVNGILSTPYMIQVRGNEMEKNKKRWGYHVFEGFAQDDNSRITMLVNKHVELGKPVAEMYYYGTEYNHSALAYNWFRIGSDVRQHSYLFSRDQAIFYGSLTLSNALTLGRIGSDNILEKEPEGDSEKYYKESAKYVNYSSLKDSEDGTIFYDKDNDIVVIKIKGKWMKLAVEPLPENINYKF